MEHVACGVCGGTRRRFEDVDVDALAGRFDVVAMFHVLEHTGDPIDTLKRCRRLVSAGGVVFVEVPNWRSARRYRQPIIRFLRPVHLFNFSPRSLAIVAAGAGLEVVERDERVWTLVTRLRGGLALIRRRLMGM